MWGGGGGCILVLSVIIMLLNRGSYMSAHVLLNLLNELRKKDKFYDCNKFNNTGAPLLGYIYHMT